ncbi:MAG: LysR family transcriptional regulator, partial [Clostridia bacterium]|nr:LysR family transcriptional regulator [Clostridia bacterium]
MNILHMKYAVEVAKAGSLSKASETLLIAQPNISRSIKELESDLGITIFERSAKGMFLTHDGEVFMNYAKSIISQIEAVEKFYKESTPDKLRFSISVPRASYISEAFAQFSKRINSSSCEVFYNETNSRRAIENILSNDYGLGIIRYAANHDESFKTMLEEKGLNYELVTQFTYQLIMSKSHPLAERESISLNDLKDYIEIAHADPYVPSLTLSKVLKEEQATGGDRKIYVFERASQFELLSENNETFMWISPVPTKMLERYNLIQRLVQHIRFGI